jgi:oligosaccharide repeat unit polymerase
VLLLAVLVSGAPIAWFLLGLCAVLVTGVLVWALPERRFFEPLTCLAVVAGVSFVVRPFQLFINSADLVSWYPAESPLDSLRRLENQEISYFATTRLQEALEPALTRTIGACAVFLLAFIAGYSLTPGRRLADRMSGLGRSLPEINVPFVVAASLITGLAGQLGVVAKTGGITEIADTQAQQEALEAGLALYIVIGFSIVGLVVWAADHRPKRRVERIAFVLATAEVLIFFTLAGSRSRVLLIVFALTIVAHYRWHSFRLRHVAVAAVVGLLFAASALAVRQATIDRPFSEAVRAAPEYISDPRAVLNDITAFDQLFVATSAIGRSLDYKWGGWIVAAFHSYVPGFIDASKPDPGDVEFRESVWGDELSAGRPTTVIGDLYYDFGFVGIILGSTLLGIAARALLGLVSTAQLPGQAVRVGLYALSMTILYQLLIGTYSIAIGSIITLVVPYLVALQLLGRLGTAASRSASQRLARLQRART